MPARDLLRSAAPAGNHRTEEERAAEQTEGRWFRSTTYVGGYDAVATAVCEEFLAARAGIAVENAIREYL